MMRYWYIWVTFVLVYTVPLRAEPLHMTTAQCLGVMQGLLQLDGQDTVVKEGEKEKVVRVPYKLSPGARLAIAKNESRLDDVSKAFNKAREGLLQQYGGEAKIKEDPKQFTASMLELLEAPCNVDLIKLKEMDLNLEANSIVASTLSLIAPIVAEK